MEFYISYPAVFWLLPIGLGAIFTWLLYFLKPQQQNFSKAKRWLLASMRFSWLALLGFLLLAPFAKSIEKQVEKPKLVLMLDNSASIISTGDSAEAKAILQKLASKQLPGLSDKMEIDVVPFDNEIRQDLDFSGKQTDLSKALKYVHNTYQGTNLSAVVLASDGIVNQGLNPKYDANLSAPIYTLPLGDTTIPRDVWIADVIHNDVVYKGNDFPMKVSVKAHNLKNTKLQVAAYHKGKLLEKKAVEVDHNRFYGEVDFLLNAKEVGVQKYSFAIEPVAQETRLENNKQSAYIEVIDAGKRVLLLAASPHPDVAALNRMLERSKHYEGKVVLSSQLKRNEKVDWDQYHLVIAHNFPQSAVDLPLLQQANDANLPVWFIAGTNQNLQYLLSAKIGVAKVEGSGLLNNVSPALNPQFSLYDVDENVIKELQQYPPVESPMMQVGISAEQQTMLLQKIGNVQSQYPLMSFWKMNETKRGLWLGNNIWRWATYYFREHEDFTEFDQFFSQIVQYLTVKDDKRRFIVKMPKRIFSDNEKITLRATLLDNTYTYYPNGSISLKVTDQAGNDFAYSFTNQGQFYQANLGILPAGEYRYTATAEIKQQTFSLNGQFMVKPVKIETQNLVANHGLLSYLSQQSKGKMYKKASIDALISDLNQPDVLSSVVKTREKMALLLNQKWWAFVIFGLMAVEWAMRKYLGYY